MLLAKQLQVMQNRIKALLQAWPPGRKEQHKANAVGKSRHVACSQCTCRTA